MPSGICKRTGKAVWKDKKLSDDHKRKISESTKKSMIEFYKTHQPSRGRLGKNHTNETKLRLSIMAKGRRHSDIAKRKMSISWRKRWANEKWAIQHFAKYKKKPTLLEKFFIDYFKKNKLPYKYTGNGTFWVNGMCPDFIDVNGKKICIEVGSKSEKNWSRGSVKDYIKKRIKNFSQFGWQVEFYWLEDFVDKHRFYRNKKQIEGEER